MKTCDDIGDELTKKVLLKGAKDEPDTSDLASRSDRRLETDGETAADDLVRLVLALVDTVRQLMERQAIRRVESGALSDDQIERLGETLMCLEERMAELKEHFGLTDADLALRLGSTRDLMDILEETSGET